MMRFGLKIKASIALDAKKFDSRYRAMIFELVCRFRYFCLSPRFRTKQNWDRLVHLYEQLASAPLVNVDGRVYARGIGGPSGHYCTTPDNSFKSFLDICVLWLLIMPDCLDGQGRHFHCYESFVYYIEMCITGDDVNVSVEESIHGWFNPKSIMSISWKIDMEYTCEFMEFNFNYNLTFLGHAFQSTYISKYGFNMYLPVINCVKMRSNMLIYNQHQKPAYTIIRCCGLRNETFACESCRNWFQLLFEFLTDRYIYDQDPEIINAFKNYKTDDELFALYTGFQMVTREN